MRWIQKQITHGMNQTVYNRDNQCNTVDIEGPPLNYFVYNSAQSAETSYLWRPNVGPNVKYFVFRHLGEI